MAEVEKKLAKEKYKSLQALVDDLDLMFNNATTFNEQGSVLYKVPVFLPCPSPTPCAPQSSLFSSPVILDDGKLYPLALVCCRTRKPTRN